MARGTRKKLVDLPAQTDPRAPLDAAAFLGRAQKVLALLAEDLLARADGSPAVTEALKARHHAEQEARRTADNYVEWRRRFTEQVAAAWLLSCVFVRTLEDRDLLGRSRIAGPDAMDNQKQFFELAPSLTERDYLLTVFRELTRLPAGRELFDSRHNPVWLLSPSAEAARALLDLFREPEAAAPAFRFGQDDTRFLGDLYQDLSEDVRKRFALLQTPGFVAAFILDRTLDRAIERFGLADTTLVDPTCGSGHFLLDAFERLCDRWLAKEPGLDVRQAAQKALDAVFGADLNPYAVAIARFRLTLAFIARGNYRSLGDVPQLPLHLAVADSLLHNPHLEQTRLMDVDGASAKDWGGEEFALEDEAAAREVLHRQHAAVVGNPPYITVKDAALREQYRALYESASGKYSLCVPFMERFFQLARKGGFVGQITANSFMKREFGKKVIESYLPSVNLDLVVNTSGAYIPGHGTPTVLLFGTTEPAVGKDVLTVLARRGEPTTPEQAENGVVWRSVADHWQEEGFENEYISVARVARATLEKHPWSLGGGGAGELKELLEERAEKRLGEIAEDIGFASFTGLDDVFILPAAVVNTLRFPSTVVRPMIVGENIRDWAAVESDCSLAPYDKSSHEPLPLDSDSTWGKFLWPYRRVAESVASFGGKSRKEEGQSWWQWYRWQKERYAIPFRIAFAFVATHNHFVLDRGGKVFKQSAPIIKLPESATEDDHLALLAYLNSSTACFWCRQVMSNRGYGADSMNARTTASAWEDFYEFAGTLLGQLPVTLQRNDQQDPLREIASGIDELARRRNAFMPRERSVQWREKGSQPLSDDLAGCKLMCAAILARMCSLQEELDWLVYEAFGLLTDEDRALLHRARGEALPGFPEKINPMETEVHAQGLHPGHRAFEVVLARDSLVSGTPTAWFDRNGYASSGTIQECYSPAYQRLIETRVAIIDRNPLVRIIEQPEYKHRWILRDFDAELKVAGIAQLASAAEGAFSSLPGALRGTELARGVLTDASLTEVVEVTFPDSGDRARSLRDCIHSEAVPFLAALRFNDKGLEKYRAWEQTWELQRREDAGEAVDNIPLPPKYDSKDFREASFWRLRGKLDVPKERFISYPGCASDEDGEPVYGWAGWNHLQRAQALATLYQTRKTEEGWGADRLTPMLAGLDELLPWVKQWHNEPDAEFGGIRLGDYFESFLETECRALGLTRDALRAWRPAVKAGGRRSKK